MTAHRCAPRRGSTLVELLVVLALLGALAAVVAPAFGRLDRAGGSSLAELIASTRRTAIERGRPAAARTMLDGRQFAVFARPDGRITVDSAGIRSVRMSGGSDERD